MKNYYLLFCFVSSLYLITACAQKPPTNSNPNIVLILADDLGYGDVGAYNNQSKISTPNIDKLAHEGLSFTDAHSNSSVCTPTRYGILTGEYAWRSRLSKGVLLGYSPSLIPEEKNTIAKVLEGNGYHTACIGKWHLGVDWKLKSGEYLTAPLNEEYTQKLRNFKDVNKIDFTKPAKGGPKGAGFDYSYILPASLDFEPYCYLENNLLTEALDTFTNGNDLKTGFTGAFWRKGHMSSSFKHDDVLPIFTNKAIDYIKNREGKEQPFFLYFPLNAPHTPWVPKDDFKGLSEAGQYGDFVAMVDAAVGQVLSQLEKSGFDDNTLILFTSDNGAYWKPEFIERFNHKSNGNFRGMKADAFEGGHRVPFIAKWTGKIEAGITNKQTISLTDIYATIQGIVGEEGTTKPKDSYNITDILLGKNNSIERAPVVHHSGKGYFAIRCGDWKWIEGLGSGGFSEPKVVEYEDGMPTGQLYNLKEDLAEKENLFFEEPHLADSLANELEKIRRL